MSISRSHCLLAVQIMKWLEQNRCWHCCHMLRTFFSKNQWCQYVIFLYVFSLPRPSNTILRVENSTFQNLLENLYRTKSLFRFLLRFSSSFLLLLSSVCMCFCVLIVTQIPEMAFHPSIWPIQVINVLVKCRVFFFFLFVTFELISI